MAMTELELTTPQQEFTTQQQEPDTQESNNKTMESKGTTLTTITTRTSTAHTGGHGWCSGSHRGGGHRQHGHYASECNATTKEVEHYCGGQTQMTNHGAGEQLLNAGVLQDDPDSNITTCWMFNQVHIIHDQTHIET